MTRLYFYAPSQYRNKAHKQRGYIAFNLCALYEEEQYNREGKKEKHYHYFDQVEASVITTPYIKYSFKVDTGHQGCQGHWAKTKSELLADKARWGFKTVTEAHYLRLRRLAIRLMQKHTTVFNAPATGVNEYTWCVQYSPYCHDIRMASCNYQYNREERTTDFLQWMQQSEIPMNDAIISEEIKLFADKRNSTGRVISMHLSANQLKHYTLPDARKHIYGKNQGTIITPPQYNRLRSAGQKVIWDMLQLNQQGITGPQTYSVRVII